jgi:CheY-like chemotaxis protein
VLLVEDNEDNRSMYREYLEWKGFGVVEAKDGVQALGQATTPALAAIVMDLALPRLDGWQVARQLKADPRTRHIPVLALSAHAFADHAKQALDAGCDDYLTKPCLPEDLARAIRSLIHGTGRRRRACARPGQADPTEDGVRDRRDGSRPGSGASADRRRTALRTET